MKTYYNFEEFRGDIKLLSKQIKEYNPDCLVPIARGGLTIGHFLAESLEIRDVVVINTISYDKDKKLDKVKVFNIPNLSGFKKIVIVDDISDSGDTLEEVIKVIKTIYPDIEIKIATIFYKPTSKVIPDFKLKVAKDWIIFFWERY
jgi:xanthine phosphoribosyltransferase